MSNEATTRLRSHVRSKKWESYKLFLLALPVLIYIFVFKYMPLWGWSYAFFSYKPGLSLAQCDFVGLQNFQNLFGNAVMRDNLFRVLRNTFGIQILNYILMPVPMLFAIFLSEIKSKRFQKVVQTVTTLPHFISWVIMFSLASSIFGSSGLINSLIHDLGFEATINILTTDDHVWLTQALLNLWKSMGWNAIVYFAAITGLDQQVYEAAEIDGANRWQKITKITIPLLMPTFFVLLVINIGNAGHQHRQLPQLGHRPVPGLQQRAEHEPHRGAGPLRLQPRHRQRPDLVQRRRRHHEVGGRGHPLCVGELRLQEDPRHQRILSKED